MTRAYDTIGGPISLVSHTGERVTEENFKGAPTLVYFGFTYCPDFCPSTLIALKNAYARLPDGVAPPQTLLITIDPERDTPQALAEFIPYFDANIIGLTGTADQIERTSKTFRIYYEKIEEAASPDGYTMGHSSQLFLFDPQGGYVGAWTYGTPAEEILADLKARMSI